MVRIGASCVLMSVLLIDLDTLKAQIAARLNRLVQLNPSCTCLRSSGDGLVV